MSTFRFVFAFLLLGVAFVCGLACVGLVALGSRNHWTSDGPAMFFVMMAIAVSGVLSLVSGLSGLSLLGGTKARSLPRQRSSRFVDFDQPPHQPKGPRTYTNVTPPEAPPTGPRDSA